MSVATMERAIRDVPQQFAWTPAIDRGERLERRSGVLVCGMGGSALAADLLRCARPDLDLVVHRSYGLPEFADDGDRLVVVSSYSGNTEETLDAYESARAAGLPVAVVGTGGALLANAERDGVPAVRIPATGIQPRMAVGFMALATAALVGDAPSLSELRDLPGLLDGASCEARGTALAAAFVGTVPLVYASDANAAIARYWKVACNETGKIPAFANVFPELNHNEMTGFDVGAGARSLLAPFRTLLLRDTSDHPAVRRRMDVFAALMAERGIGVTTFDIAGTTRWHRIADAAMTAMWMSLRLAQHYGAEPEQVPMVEEFKRRIGHDR